MDISGSGTMEVLQDGFGFLRSPEANYLSGPDDVYVSPSQIRKFGLRTGDSVEGGVRSPREGERYFALVKVDSVNFESPDNVRHKVAFDNLTPLYPEQRLTMEIEDPTLKDRSGRVIDVVAPHLPDAPLKKPEKGVKPKCSTVKRICVCLGSIA